MVVRSASLLCLIVALSSCTACDPGPAVAEGEGETAGEGEGDGEGEGEGEAASIALTATPAAINAGDTVALQYAIDGAVNGACVLTENGAPLAVVLDGTDIERTPASTSTYVMQCGATSSPPLIVPVSSVVLADGSAKLVGTPLVLALTAQEIADDACAATNAAVALTSGAGTVTVTSDVDVDVTLTCAAPGGAIEVSRSIVVVLVDTSAPAIADAGAPIAIDVVTPAAAVCAVTSADLAGADVRDEPATETIDGDTRVLVVAPSSTARQYTVFCALDGLVASDTATVRVRPGIVRFEADANIVGNELEPTLAWEIAPADAGACTFDDGTGPQPLTGDGLALIEGGPTRVEAYTIACALDDTDPAPHAVTVRVLYTEAGEATDAASPDLATANMVVGALLFLPDEPLALPNDTLALPDLRVATGGVVGNLDGVREVSLPALVLAHHIEINGAQLALGDFDALTFAPYIEFRGVTERISLASFVEGGEITCRSSVAAAPVVLSAPALERLEKLRFTSSQGVLTLELPALTDLGELRISSAPETLSVTLPALAHVGALAVGSSALASISLPALQTLESVSLPASIVTVELPSLAVAASLVLSGDNLVTVDVGSLVQAGDVTVQAAPLLTSLDLSHLVRVGVLSISETAIDNVALLLLQDADGIDISDVTTVSFPSLDEDDGVLHLDTTVVDGGFPALLSVGGPLVLQSVGSAQSGVLSLPNLASVGGDFIISATSLQSVELPSLTTAAGSFVVVSNPGLSCAEIAAVYCPLTERTTAPLVNNNGGQADCNATVNDGC